MTFYWWSHWFWITCLCVQLLPHVHTYPSQDVSLESSTQQQLDRALDRTEATEHGSGRRQTTKLYQTTSSQTWTTVTQRNIMDLTIKTTPSAPKITPAYADAGGQQKEEEQQQQEQEQEEEQEEESSDAIEDVEAPFSDSVDEEDSNGDDVDMDADADEQSDADGATVKLTMSHNQFEFKRSADFAASVAAEGSSDQLNNYTNFSRITSTNNNSSACNATCVAAAVNARGLELTTTAAKSAAANTTTGSTSSTTIPPPTTTKISTTNTTKTITTNTITTKAATTATSTITTTTTTSPPINSTAGQAVAATPSTPKINTEWLSDELQRVPFTLENANKEDELRRAESEHRSRKSKVLSAEYKHINRYINFSSDSKSLLTRSASAAPSVSDADEGGNISSEALAIQRTYFLDAGSISAICFTVFGICCTVGTIGIVLYRRRYVNKPQALSEPDSSVYIDDSTMRDNSDEMYSLDNDSFLNSLEAMTIQNYWTDTVKHTKL
ncbi:GH12004 [Drosophila grimshawi]|uniref:GH12004 n=1 Tax=Drosophila grimshawi TaxID=7222 RepID=B4JKS5_DROGR|nr:GH12004 [Drosophila grimshawi]